MDKKILVVVLVISVAINLATVFTLGYFWWTRHGVARQDVFIRPNMMHELHQTRMARELNLSDRQIEEMKKVNEEMRLTMQPLREALFKKRQALMSLLRDEDMERAKADVLIEQIARLQAEHDARIFDRILSMKKILTSEQQRRLGSLMHTLLESGRPPDMPHAPVHPHRRFELPRGEKGR
jgi:Spy/CpxP family protein refolding chaperone